MDSRMHQINLERYRGPPPQITSPDAALTAAVGLPPGLQLKEARVPYTQLLPLHPGLPSALSEPSPESPAASADTLRILGKTIEQLQTETTALQTDIAVVHLFLLRRYHCLVERREAAPGQQQQHVGTMPPFSQLGSEREDC